MNTTVDTLLDGKIVIHQPAKGFRAGTDSLLLASAVPEKPGSHYLDVGCGCGGALLPSAWRLRQSEFTGLDIDPATAKLAKLGAQANGLDGRVSVETANISDWATSRENSFDAVFSNPPYFARLNNCSWGEVWRVSVETANISDWATSRENSFDAVFSN
ncbi:MAG: methyltransferase domain-containing protein, partial [Pseudomonadota bacterium]